MITLSASRNHFGPCRFRGKATLRIDWLRPADMSGDIPHSYRWPIILHGKNSACFCWLKMRITLEIEK